MTNEQILQLVRHHAIDHEYWSETRTLAFARALLSASKPAAPKSCQTGWGDICHMAKHDGVTCPNESCDIDDGIRAAPAQSPALIGWWNSAEASGFRWKEGIVRGDFSDGTPIYANAAAPAQSGSKS